MSGDKPRILVVEDNRETQLILKAVFRNNYLLQFSESEDDATNIFSKEEFDIILLDFNLKGSGNGRSLLKRIREGDNHSGIPVLVISAYDLNPDDEKFFNSNADGFLPKPVNKKLLLQTIENILDKEHKKS